MVNNSTSNPWVNALAVLKQQTLDFLEKRLNRETCNLVDNWAASNPSTLKAWEKDGTLLDRAEQAQAQAIKAQQNATEDGVSHLSA